MPDIDSLSDVESQVENPYEILGLETSASADEVKSAYRKAALKNHPDKVAENLKAVAHQKFQTIAFAYAILSDPARRKRYDTTGSTSDSIVDADGFNWSDFYSAQFENSVSDEAIQEFATKYKGSLEESQDVLDAYDECEGDLDGIFERVMLSDIEADDARFRNIINSAIDEKQVSLFPAWERETGKKREARRKKAAGEAIEAEDLAKELGVHGKLYGKQKTQGNSNKAASEDSLAALIRGRQQERSESFLDHLAEKYSASKSGKGQKGKKGSKRAVEEEEPSEEAFQAAAAKLNGSGKKSRR